MNIRLLLILLLTHNFVFNQTITEVDSINAIPHNELIKDLNASKTIFTENITNAELIKYPQGAAMAKTKLAMVYYYLQQADQAMKLTFEATAYYEQEGDWKNAAITYSDIGFAFKATNLPQALTYFRKAIGLIEAYPPGAHSEKIYNNYGVLQNYKTPKCLDSALFYHKKAYQIALSLNLTEALPYDLNNIALIYSALGEFDKAFLALDKSDSYRKLEDNALNWADNLAYRADIYFDMEANDSAIFYYNRSLNLADSSQFINLSKYCLERLSELYERKNDATKSLEYYKKLQTLKDSVYTLETNIAIAQLQEEYDVAQKEKTIITQEKLVNEQYTQIVTLILLLTLLILIIYFIYRTSKSKQVQLEKDIIIEKANSLNQVQNEKIRISRDLHDNIGSQLTYVISSLDNLNYITDEHIKQEKLDKLELFTKNTLTELRDTIWTIKGEPVSYDELMTRTQDYITKLKENYQTIRFIINTTSSTRVLDADIARACYRTLQEGINNSLKHAEPYLICVTFTPTSIVIEDDGNGFKQETIKRGNGLNNMKARILEIGGNLDITSKMNTGTKINIVLPTNTNT